MGSNEIAVCVKCEKPMRHNVPRLGDSAGYVHSDTGSPVCAEDILEDLIKKAKNTPLTPAMIREQKISWLMGMNLSSKTTREQAEEIVDREYSVTYLSVFQNWRNR